ncbi:MAG: hypothetical protein LC800_03250, partial [Acidobacteria bacterium]|nr:hypothetical protein [Acidobacteriota bacterium]
QRALSECAEGADCDDVEELQRLLSNIERVASVLTTAMLGGVGMSAAGSSGKGSNPDGVIERF